jgi:hypothetical protein
MTTTIDTISTMLDELAVKHGRISDTAIGFGVRTRRYRSLENQPNIDIVVDVSEAGKYLTIVAPLAFRIDGEHRAVAFETCLRFQWSYKMVRFEFDARDGEVRPSIHVPLMDSPLGKDQLGRLLGCLVQLCDEIHPLLVAALESGQMMPDQEAPSAQMAPLLERLSELSPEQLELLLSAVAASPTDTPTEAPTGDEAAA